MFTSIINKVFCITLHVSIKVSYNFPSHICRAYKFKLLNQSSKAILATAIDH